MYAYINSCCAVLLKTKTIILDVITATSPGFKIGILIENLLKHLIILSQNMNV